MSETDRKGLFGISQSNKSAWRNPWVLGWIAMVVLVFAINAFMVGQAFTTAPGLVNEQYYERGENYHETVARRQQVEALGWEVTITHPERIRFRENNAYHLVAVDAAGTPLRADQVVLHAYRPSDQRADFNLPFVEEEPGRYRVDVDYPLKGMWDVVIQLTQGEHNYEVAKRTKVWD